MRFVHALFIISAELAVTQLISVITAFVAQRFWLFGSNRYCVAMIILLAIVLIVYVASIYRFGKRIILGLFTYTTSRVWLFYSFFCPVIVFFVKYFYMSPAGLTPVYIKTDAYSLAVPALMTAIFILMCASIMSTHSRLAAEYELGISQHIIKSGHNEDARKFLDVLTEKGDETEIKVYSDSRVLNALLYGYDERCEKEGIEFFTQIEIEGGGFDAGREGGSDAGRGDLLA